MRVARGFGLKIILKDGQNYKYHGFKEIVSFLLMRLPMKIYVIVITFLKSDLCNLW